MGKPVNRVLFVNSEIMPFLPETPISKIGRCLPQGIQERKKEIRAFMPRYGCINERKNQLHEVIRLSGMNIIIGDVDRPLVIKVASISSARIQVYFIDNEDYFRRKQIARDADGKFFEDNGQRAIFFARGVLETVKKLRWAPDIILAFGVFLCIRAKIFVAAGEGIVLVISFISKIKFSIIKNCFDCTLVAISLAISFMHFGVMRGVGLGTIAAALLVGRWIQLYSNKLHIFDKWSILE